jgi:tRNA-(ms[2]io[6]A)-hydroxylase
MSQPTPTETLREASARLKQQYLAYHATFGTCDAGDVLAIATERLAKKYRALYDRVHELNAIAIEELQHFELVLKLLSSRGIPFGQPFRSPWISGMMSSVRQGQRESVIDHLIVCALVEGRSCEKFQILSKALASQDPELSEFYGSLVESEGNHYASYLIMARHIDEAETDRRLDWYLDLDARWIREPNPEPMLH